MLELRTRRLGFLMRNTKPSALLAAVALGLLLTACTPPGPSAGASQPANVPERPGSPQETGGSTQTSDGGKVTIAVTWQGAEAGPIFTVAMDTHSVDLDRYDLGQLAVLRTEDGRESSPTGWDAPKGGHHRQGLLVFPAATPDGGPLIMPGQSVELIVRDVAGVAERKFRWSA